LIFRNFTVACQHRKAFPDRINSGWHQTRRVPRSKETQTISNKFRKTARIINRFESLFSAWAVRDSKQVPEPLFEFLHESSFSRAKIEIILHAFRILNHSAVDIHSLCCGVTVEQPPKAQGDVKGIALGSFSH